MSNASIAIGHIDEISKKVFELVERESASNPEKYITSFRHDDQTIGTFSCTEQEIRLRVASMQAWLGKLADRKMI